jgi:hypothetical protein
MLLPWGVKSAVLLDADTLVTGDIGRLWNSSDVTTRSRSRPPKKPPHFWQVAVVEGDRDTAVKEENLVDKEKMPQAVVAAVPNCDITPTKVSVWNKYCALQHIEYDSGDIYLRAVLKVFKAFYGYTSTDSTVVVLWGSRRAI